MEMGNRRSPRRAELDELAFTRRASAAPAPNRQARTTYEAFTKVSGALLHPSIILFPKDAASNSPIKVEDAIMHEGHPDSTAAQRETSSDTKMEDEQHAISDDVTLSEPAPPATDVKEEQSDLGAVITAGADNGETMGPPPKRGKYHPSHLPAARSF
ncbi:hypothetical protein PG996_003494 [Apiospora saccharicola]|uniref:Uncharacterized protein n=1 Tax=Apiospora saccharicola TaxID=335842 RepID=A0ABR1W1G1_9PEZI